MKYIIIILCFLIFPLATKAASGLTINLFYSDGKLSFTDPAVEQNKNLYVSISEFSNQNKNSIGPFTLLITNWDNIELATKRFNAQPGAFSLTVPYYSNIKKLAIFETNSAKLILEKDVGDISTCNTNNICEFEKGETASTCLLDCGVSQPNYSSETKKLLKTNGGVITDTSGKTLLKESPKSSAVAWAVVTIVAVAGFVAAFIIIRRRRYGR